MKTEDWEQIFREKVNGLSTPPPKTQWSRTRSWEQLQAQLSSAPDQSTIQSRTSTPLWVYYAAASVSLLLLFTFAFTVYIRQQEQEINQLHAALHQMQNRSHTLSQPWATISPQHQPESDKNPDLAKEEKIIPLSPSRMKKPNFRMKSDEALPKQPISRPTEESEIATALAEQSDRRLSVPTAAKPKANLPTQETALKTFLMLSAGNANRTETSVTLTFPGNESLTVDHTLAEETPQPRKKRLLQMLLNGRNNENASEKPAEWLGLPPFMIAKTNK